MNEIAELRGRLVALETILAAMLTHIAELAPDPAALIVAIMANAEDMLEAAEAADPGAAEAAQAARGAFDDLSDALQHHLQTPRS